MTTIAKDVAAKLAVAVVAVAMVFSAFAPAQAQTTEDLQQMINDLLAQVAQLQASTGVSAGTGTCVSIMAPLTIGAQGAEVTALQNRLIADGQVIPAGATGYFGSQTQAALAGWQAAKGVSPAVGYYGPITKAAMDASCTPTTTPGDEDEDEDMDEDEDVSLGGEASLDKAELDSASDDELEEGAEDAEIATVTFEFADGDASISRLDIALVGSGDEQDPWDTFDEISLWVDGDKVADMEASDEDDYLDEDDGTLRFTGLDLVAMEDEELEIVIAATIQNSVDGTDDGENWTVAVNAVRFFDADGVATTEDDEFDLDGQGNGQTVSFSIDEAGFEDEVLVKTSSSDPDSTTLQVEDDKKSDWYTVFVFDLDTDDSISDIEFNRINLEVIVGTSTGGYNGLVDDAELVIDGVTIDDVTVTNGGTATATLSFDVDGDVVVDAGDRVAAELMLRFKSLALGNEGVTVQGRILSATTANIDAEGSDDLDNTQLSGSATGDAHTLRTTGIDTEMTDDSAVVTTGDNALDDYGTFEIEVEVTAFEQDVFISTDPSVAVAYLLQDGAGSSSVAGSRSATLSSSADENGGYFEINEGETETITLTVTYTPGVANTASRLVLSSISFNETAAAPDQTQTTLPATDYRTSVITMVN